MEQDNLNEKKVTNKFYVAVYVLLFVFSALFILGAIMILSVSLNGVFVNMVYDSLIEQGYDAAMAEEQALMIGSLFGLYCGVLAVGAVVMIIEACFFVKYSRQTNFEAEQNYGKCLAWVIVSYFFGGLIVGGLATAGLLVVQNKQRQELANGAVWKTSDGKQVNITTTPFIVEEDRYTPENIEKMKIRLQKLKDLKDTGAITDEEFTVLRNKVMGKEVEKKEAAVVDDNPNELNAGKLDKMGQRLAKIKELKEAGALSDEEYNKLRDKIINEDK